MKPFICLLAFFVPFCIFSQELGNAYYHKGNFAYDPSPKGITISPPEFLHSSEIIIEVNGLYNLTADTYVAIFSLTQVGATAHEANLLMDQRLDSVRNMLQKFQTIETYTDLISFVPQYEFEAEKKRFSRKTYNEVPKGFDLKKNFHVKYTDPEVLSAIIGACATQEIYDLVRVDYVSSQMDSMKQKMMKEAEAMLNTKMAYYERVLGVDFTDYMKIPADAWNIFYPAEEYQSYVAYSSPSLDLARNETVINAEKQQTMYYQPMANKQFDFVENPVIMQPVIQMVYTLRLKIIRPEPEVKKDPIVQTPQKEYFIIDTNGQLQRLQL